MIKAHLLISTPGFPAAVYASEYLLEKVLQDKSASAKPARHINRLISHYRISIVRYSSRYGNTSPTLTVVCGIANGATTSVAAYMVTSA